MERTQLYYRYNPWWDGNFSLDGIIERPKLLSNTVKLLDSKDIILLTGLRRVGKTTLMRMLISYLIVKVEIASKYIFYLSMDDYSLKDKTLAEIIDEYRKIHKIKFAEKIYLFLDEITALRDYEIQLKNFYDTQNVKIIASSSSASILRERKAHMTGRHRFIEVPPLDFEEYLFFKDISIKPADRGLLESYFEDYMKTGGMPEHVLTGEIEYLKNLVDDIIYKDIAAVNGIKNLRLLKDFFLILMERAGKPLSINKMARILDISPDTSKRYLSLFENTFLINLIPKSGKLNVRLKSQKKLYVADLGIRVLFTGYRDIGSLFENYVYNLVKKQNPEYLVEDGIEIDFLTEEKILIEVKYNDSLRPEQQKLFDSFPAKEKIIIGNVYDLEKLNKIFRRNHT
ncbi:MAG: ATP-binding protein [Verrucomicrobiota bacterium]|nr:ATP-binding protein [Verrucomicrobiota bacterium]